MAATPNRIQKKLPFLVGDITFEKQSAERLVGLLNENEVELCHARDVIEDYIFNETTLEIKYYGE